MDDKTKQPLRKIIKRQQPDMSHVKPPKESAATKMARNLKAAADTKVDNSPKPKTMG